MNWLTSISAYGTFEKLEEALNDINAMISKVFFILKILIVIISVGYFLELCNRNKKKEAFCQQNCYGV